MPECGSSSFVALSARCALWASWTFYVKISTDLHVEAGELVLDACGGEVDGEALLELAPLQHRDGLLPAAAALLRHEEHPLPLLLLRVQHVLQLQVCIEAERQFTLWQIDYQHATRNEATPLIAQLFLH